MRTGAFSRYGILVLSLLIAGCGMPRDPEGTMERVGLSAQPPWTSFDDERAAGIEAELIQQFARQLNAEVEFQPGAESELFHALKTGGLDLVIGGLEDSSPWSAEVALTRPYLTIQGQKHVLAAPQGENRWLLELEKFLQSHRGEAMRLYQQAPQT